MRIRDARCRVPIPAGAAGRDLRVRLFGSSTPRRQEPLGTWDFPSTPAGPEPTAVEVDLWNVDRHAVRLATAGGGRMAAGFRRSIEDAISARLGLELTAADAHRPPLLGAELVLDAGELAALRRRLHLGRVPPIEWFFVELTNRCNLACPWCPSPSRMARPRGAMTLERARELWRMIADYRAAHPRFSLYAEVRNRIFLHLMGEPFLHPQLFEILDEGHRLGLDFCLVTNASMLTADRLGRLLDSGLKAIVVSLNVAGADQYRMVRSPVSHQTVVAQARELIAERYRRGRASPRIEIQLLCTDGVALPGQPSLGDRPAVEAELLAWQRFVREHESRAGAVAAAGREPPAPAALLPAEGELEARHPVGENVAVVVKRACNFANALLPEGASLEEAIHGRCPAQNPHRVLCVLWDGSCTFCSLDYDGEVEPGERLRKRHRGHLGQ